MNISQIIGVYIVIINGLTCALFGIDKLMARSNAWRVSEKVLWFFSLLGGSLGGFFGMHFFRHKTQKMEFQLVMLLIAALQIGLLIMIYTYVL